jgi:hypothetical protein
MPQYSILFHFVRFTWLLQIISRKSIQNAQSPIHFFCKRALLLLSAPLAALVGESVAFARQPQ